ncbi:MAG: SDR family oxidoreductase [Candidatus Rokubacteria bacterium]|nr:SDR family oxidoreductase [Candidatus Rokubacteria bacterium]
MNPVPAAAALTFRDIQLGQRFEIERTFTADDVERFAALSGDWSPLHVDPAYAASTEFGGCVLHGMLLASLFSRLVGMHIPGAAALYLGQDLAFRRPVLVGERVQASAKVTAKNEATATLALATEIRNEAGLVVVSGAAKVKVRGARPGPEAAAPPPPAHPDAGRRVALVTGASRGIGGAIARRLAARDIAVAVNYHQRADRAQQQVRDIRQAGGHAVAVQADVREPDQVSRMVRTVADELGGLSLVVNAAIGGLEQHRFVDLDWAAFQQQLDYQLKAVVHVCQAAYPLLKAAGGGAIVNVLSQAASGVPPALMADYVAAKYALHGLSKALAVEWAADGVRVNTVSPGLTRTDLTEHYPDRVFKMEAARVPLRRLASLEDVASAVAFMLSDESAFLTGVDVPVSGGQVMP